MLRGTGIFFTSEEPEIIEERLSSEGIDAGLFKQRNSLCTYSIKKSGGTTNDALSTQAYKERCHRCNEASIPIYGQNDNRNRNIGIYETRVGFRKSWS
jgi:hypothetical protein